MTTNTPCPRCGKTNPAEIHTCTTKEDIEEWFKKQDQKADSKYAQPGKLKPMNGDQVLEGFRAIEAIGESFILRYFLKGVRYAEKYHGIGGKE